MKKTSTENRDIDLIIDELAVAACEAGINCDALAEMVRARALEVDLMESGEAE